jgi:hypothetical protein
MAHCASPRESQFQTCFLRSQQYQRFLRDVYPEVKHLSGERIPEEQLLKVTSEAAEKWASRGENHYLMYSHAPVIIGTVFDQLLKCSKKGSE